MNTLADFLPPGALIQRSASPYPLLVLVAPHAASQPMLSLAARLALRSPLRLLDGGNRSNARLIARLLRSMGAADLYQALQHIQIARAFTCYQMTTLLEEISPSTRPTLVIDLLDTFYDESAPLPERLRLAERCLLHLRKLSAQAPAVVSLRPPNPSRTDPTGLLDLIQSAADLLWIPEQDAAASASPPQLPLF